MRKHVLSLAAAALALAVGSAPLLAQDDPRPSVDRYTVAGAFGGVSGGTELNEGGTADWQPGWAASVDATYWLHRHVGVRAGAGVARDSISGVTVPGRGTFNKFVYDASVVVRYPLRAGSGTLSPYAVGGAGGISVHQLGSDSTWSKPAANFGVGVEYRLKRLGFRAEGRDFVYTFDRYGIDRTQHDVAWQGGVTLSF
jgi:hypothetical protein